MTVPPLIAMIDISKSFGAVVALQHVNLELGHGEVMGLVGDNAAGKSTLMKILSGAYRPDGGQLRVEGKAVEFHGPPDARRLGIEMIYQDFALIPQLTVTQNIFLGRENVRGGPLAILDSRRMDEQARAMFDGLGLRVPSVRSPVRQLSGGQQQAVAIARATAFAAKLVIMDEPTANLGATAIEKVRESIKRLKAKGISVIIISHRLEDVFAVSDRVMVMKHGRVVGNRATADTQADEVLHMIIAGRDPRTPAGERLPA
jgi:ABC-type sugar transport system ATPase subunit